MKKQYLYTKTIRFWLLTGLIMLIGQVILGGITRLTGSGLSITSWDIVTGVIPPMNKQQWIELFDLYKQTPQFQKINSDFTLKQFKFRILLSEIKCKTDFTLIQKYDSSPTCVKPATKQKLIERGWAKAN